jgi:hypothetical protein
MDPTEHSIESVQTLQPLFDQVLRVTADGSIEAVQI